LVTLCGTLRRLSIQGEAMVNDSDRARRPVLVTGGTGLVGSHLVEDLLTQGHRVTCLVRRSSDVRALQRKPVQIVRADFLDNPDELIRIVDGHRVIYHVAGAVRALDYSEFLRANGDVTEELVDACLAAADRPERFVLVSSIAAAGPPPAGERLTEFRDPLPVSDYGRSKLDGERRALRAAGTIKVIIVRPTAIYGPGDREMLPVFRMAKLGLVLAVAGKDQILNLCHVADVSRGIALAGEAPLDSGEVIQLGAEKEHTITEMGEIFCQLFGRRPHLVALPPSAVRSAAWASESWARFRRRPAMFNRQKVADLIASWPLDLSVARSRIGYQPSWDLPEGAADTLRWYQSMGWL
jgi:dihydroflavonol-4-reductase